MTTPRQKGLFFDFDGVLADSVRIKTAAFTDLFSAYGDEVIEKVIAYHRLHGGISRVEKIRYAFEEVMRVPLSTQLHRELADRYAAMVTRKVIESAWIAGAREFLETMRGQLPMFVISGTPQGELRHVLAERGMSHYFQAILGSPAQKAELVAGLLYTHRLAPANCAFIGDAMTDYNAAMATGLHFVGIQGDIAFPATVEVLPDCQGLACALERIFGDRFFLPDAVQ